MAGAAADYHRGDQDIHAQEATFHAVMIGTKWGSLAIAATVLFLTMWFCTDAGLSERPWRGRRPGRGRHLSSSQ